MALAMTALSYKKTVHGKTDIVFSHHMVNKRNIFLVDMEKDKVHTMPYFDIIHCMLGKINV